MHILVEKFFAAVVMIAGKMLLGWTLGSIAATLANSEASRNAYENKLRNILTYLFDQHADNSIMARVENYYNCSFEQAYWSFLFLPKMFRTGVFVPRTVLCDRNRGIMDMQSLLRDTPFCMRTELGFKVHEREIRNVSALLTQHSGVEQLCVTQFLTVSSHLFYYPTIAFNLYCMLYTHTHRWKFCAI